MHRLTILNPFFYYTKSVLFFVVLHLISISAVAGSHPKDKRDLNIKKNDAGVIFYSSADFGIGSVDEDLFLMLMLEQGIAVKNLKLVFSGPFRFRIKDNTPLDSGVLRNQDWDDASDWARILRSADYNQTLDNGRIDIHLGELNGVSMGSGSIINDYFNSIDMDYYQGGAALAVDINGTGIEFMMHNVISPGIFAGRTYISPFAWFSDNSLSRRFSIGFDFALDTGVDGQIVPQSNSTIFIAGGNIDFNFIQTRNIFLSFLVDVNGLRKSGGVDAGIGSSFFINRQKETELHITGKYLYAGKKYYSSLINPFYEYNRRWFSVDPVSGVTQSFAEHLDNSAVKKRSAHGFSADLELSAGETFKIGFNYTYQNHNRPDWLMFRFELSPVERFSLRGFFAGQDMFGSSNIFSSYSLAGLSLQIKIIGSLRVYFEFLRRYRNIKSSVSSASNEISGGIGVSIAY